METFPISFLNDFFLLKFLFSFVCFLIIDFLCFVNILLCNHTFSRGNRIRSKLAIVERLARCKDFNNSISAPVTTRSGQQSLVVIERWPLLRVLPDIIEKIAENGVQFT